MLYYLRQEVIGDQAERILEGAESRLVKHLLSVASFQRLFNHIFTRFKGPTFPLSLSVSLLLLSFISVYNKLIWSHVLSQTSADLKTRPYMLVVCDLFYC